MAINRRFEPPALDRELVYKTSRSSGKGGQHVNKVSSRVQVYFSVNDSAILSDEEKRMLVQRLGERLSRGGMIQVTSQSARSQAENKAIAAEKMYALINRCFVVRKKRVATRPSKASIEKRLHSKKRNAAIKELRKGADE